MATWLRERFSSRTRCFYCNRPGLTQFKARTEPPRNWDIENESDGVSPQEHQSRLSHRAADPLPPAIVRRAPSCCAPCRTVDCLELPLPRSALLPSSSSSLPLHHCCLRLFLFIAVVFISFRSIPALFISFPLFSSFYLYSLYLHSLAVIVSPRTALRYYRRDIWKWKEKAGLLLQ